MRMEFGWFLLWFYFTRRIDYGRYYVEMHTQAASHLVLEVPGEAPLLTLHAYQ